jgi:hypothetical protein
MLGTHSNMMWQIAVEVVRSPIINFFCRRSCHSERFREEAEDTLQDCGRHKAAKQQLTHYRTRTAYSLFVPHSL